MQAIRSMAIILRRLAMFGFKWIDEFGFDESYNLTVYGSYLWLR